jgi:hypothetical protein
MAARIKQKIVDDEQRQGRERAEERGVEVGVGGGEELR